MKFIPLPEVKQPEGIKLYNSWIIARNRNETYLDYSIRKIKEIQMLYLKKRYTK